jgi:hypothetical protein
LTPSSSRQGPFRKPKADIFTLLLVLGLVAIITGCILFYLEVADYGTQAYTRADSLVGQPAVDTACPSRGGSLALPDPWMNSIG